MVIVLDAKLADTPAGNPLAPSKPSLLMPVAPVVVCVMFVSAVLMHNVGVDDAALAVLLGVTVTVVAAEVALQPLPSVTVTV